MIHINLTVNGKEYSADVSPSLRLVDLLREDFNLTGAKEGCGEGECGACTVIMNGKAVLSCLMLAFQADGAEITTIEGVAADNELDALQKAFMEKGAIQCGYCTPGMILSAKALLIENPAPSEDDIKTAISGNLCRCTGYNKIIDAITSVANAPDSVKNN